MKTFENVSPLTRRSVLAVILLAVLLVSTAAAWLLTKRSHADPADQWYLARDGSGEIVGWRIIRRESEGDSPRHGYDVSAELVSDGASLHWSKWQTTADQKTWQYAAGQIPLQGRPHPPTTVISFRNGRLLLSRLSNGQTLPMSVKISGAYLVAWQTWPAIVHAAQTGEALQSSLLLNNGLLPVLTVQPTEQAETMSIDGQSAPLRPVQVIVGPAEDPLGSYLYHVAENGTIPLIESFEGEQINLFYELTDSKTLLKHFPRALSHRRQALDDYKGF